MKRSEDRILTTHVGSLPRPRALTDLGGYLKGAPEDPDAYARQLKSSVAEIVKQQAAVGLDIINEGEFGKESWANYIIKRISGFEIRPDQIREVEWLGSDRVRFAEFLAEEFPRAARGSPTEACIGPIAYADPRPIALAIEALEDALKKVTVVEAFMTAVAPASTAYDGVNEYYSSERDYVFAIAEALREEYLAIHRAGLLVQVDDAVL
ncbi:MAG TPA: hypothetical protein VHX64_14710, partial [Caulobacteraceae bacterium]|nr:hypothetical protein [Caulobacteraceae bacterium]